MILKIANGKIVTSSGIKRSNLYIKDDRIYAITHRKMDFNKKIDATNYFVFPGLIDAHVHLDLQQGNFHTATDFEAGTKIALSSGITTIIDYLPYSQNEIPQKEMYVNYSFHKVITKLPDEKFIKDYISKGINSFKIFTTYSKNGWMLNDGEILELMKMIKKYDGILEAHCENDGIILFNERRIKPQIMNLPRIHPPISEIEAIRRLAFFARKTNVHLHIVHTTLYESVKYINELKKQKLNITFETCPQYLFFDESFLKRKVGVLYTCNPPLRSEKNSKKLFKYFLSRKIDMLTTDHCSFKKEEKMHAENIFNLPFGVPSLPYSLLLMLNVFKPKQFPHIVDLMGVNPAKIFKIKNRGDIRKNYFADVVIVKEKDLENMEINQFDPSGYNPYYFIKNQYKVVATIVNGKIAYENGEIKEKAGKFVKRF